MAIEFCEILILKQALKIPPVKFHPASGAVIDFLGVVRNMEDDAPILGIDYEVNNEMAMHQLHKIAGEAKSRFSYENLVLHHRVGFVPVAEPSLFLRVSAQRRRSAFDACEWIIDQLKQVVPIWKRPVKEL